MSWNMDEISKSLIKGNKGLFGAMSVGGHIMGKGFNYATAPIGFVGKYAKKSYIEKARELDKIKNPHLYEETVKGKKIQRETRRKVDSSGNVTKELRENNSIRQKLNLTKHFAKENLKSFGIGTAISGAMYGLGAYMTDNKEASHGDRAAHYAKYAVAGGIDVAADALLTGVSFGLATLGGPAGMIAAGGLQMFNMFAGFAGMDAGSLAMRVMDYADEEYDKSKLGPKFNMTQNTTMALQRQIQNLHASGSNLGEMMHN